MSGSTPSHKPRKKKNAMINRQRTDTNVDIVLLEESTNTAKPAFPLVAFFWPARGNTSQWVLLPPILLVAGLFRWAVGLWGYSGRGKPPMYGDFEAQRHWMEITACLPASWWYLYDLQYWGLDYPPLTAYHSWLMGTIGSFIDSGWFALDTSRGSESQLLKVFMRATVIVSEYFVYVPAAVIFLRRSGRSQGVGNSSQTIALVAFLMQPATILIDHGHFQYNTVMLGFVIASLSSIYAGRLLWSCVFFVAALGYKQMALYYSPVIFAYLLSQCITPRVQPGRLLTIALTTALAFVVLFAPLLLSSLYDTYRGIPPIKGMSPPPLFDLFQIKYRPQSLASTAFLQLTQSIHRIFPFARGLFEDKVANFWCALNTIVKLRVHVEPLIPLPRLSLYLTFVATLPSFLLTLLTPLPPSYLPYALASSSLAFFLFSFQVHEKSILLPLLPLTLLLGSREGLSKEIRAWVGWANSVALFTLYPLLARDGLRTPYAVLGLLWAYLLGLPPTSLGLYYDHANQNEPGKPRPHDDLGTLTKILHVEVYLVMLVWHGLEAFIPPPEGMPDLWVVVNVCLGAAVFGVLYLWSTWKVVLGSGILQGYFDDRKRMEAGQKKTN